MTVSVIIPTLNEATTLPGLLEYLSRLNSDMEIIVADGGSEDSTIGIAQSIAKVVNSPRGRGAQMNAGANVAIGDILWFIHADCTPHPKSYNALIKTMCDSKVVGGGFEYSLNHPAFRFRITETWSNTKNRWFKMLYGDMGIFVRRNIFEGMGGYKEIPLMEDMDFSRRLKKEGRVVVLPYRMETSARRWIEEGYWKCNFRSTVLQSAWNMGVSPKILSRWYKFK